MERAQDRGHIRALDGIRGFALLAVFAFHALTFEIVASSPIASFVHNVVQMGWVGVDLFFVLSGFLITTILLDAREAENYFKVFYARRALRVLPLYYLVLVVYLLLVKPGYYSLKAQLFYWLSLSNLPTAFKPFSIPLLNHFWSLAVEEQFYFVWPLLVRRLRVRTLAYVCCAAIAGDCLVRNLPVVLALNQRWPQIVYRLTPFRIDTICSGALLAVIVQRWRDLSRFRAYLRLLFLCSAALFLYADFGTLYMAVPVVRFGYTALTVCFASLVALSLYPKSITARIFSFPLLRRTGKYSYCFYLVHPFFVIYVVDHQSTVRRIEHWLRVDRLSNNMLHLGIFFVEFWVIFAFCALSWQFFEGPILRLKHHVRYKPSPQVYLA